MDKIQLEELRKLLHLDSTYFKSEKITPREPEKPLPERLEQLRELGYKNIFRYTTPELFYAQGTLAADYEDDEHFTGTSLHLVPTYSSLSDRELRGYFGWRTRYRKGQVEKTPKTFLILYLFEILNLIGVPSPEEGYQRFLQVEKDYENELLTSRSTLDEWKFHYCIYYNLKPAVMPEAAEKIRIVDRTVHILEDEYNSASDQAIFEALDRYSTYSLTRSQIYKQNPEGFISFFACFFRALQDYYQSHRSRFFTEDYLGKEKFSWLYLFPEAVFSFPCGAQDGYEYHLDEQSFVRSEAGFWTTHFFTLNPVHLKRLGKMLKAAEALMRVELQMPPLKMPEGVPKWFVKLVKDVLDRMAEAKAREEKRHIHLDLGQLSSIRADAAVTRDKLMTEAEMREEGTLPVNLPEAMPNRASETGSSLLQASPEPENDSKAFQAGSDAVQEAPGLSDRQGAEHSHPFGLTDAEYRLLQALLYGGDWRFAEKDGLMLSLLVDGINEKVYDEFGDTVLTLEERPELVPDYIDDLKGFIAP